MADYLLLERQRKLLRLLNTSHGYMTGMELSSKLGVSSRTVRSDIAEISRLIDPAAAKILANRGKGYSLRVDNRNLFHRYISGTESLLTREDRSRHLLLALLWAEAPIDLDAMEDEMFVSRNTLETDLRLLQKILRSHSLSLSRKGSQLSISAGEYAVRALILRIYSENLDFSSRAGIVMQNGFPDAELLHSIRHCLKEGLRRQNLLVDDFRFMYCALAFWLSYRRRGKSSPLCPPCGQETAAASAVIRHTLSLLPDGISICQPEELHWLAAVLTRLLPPSPAEAVIILPPLDTAAPNVPFLQDAQLRLEIASFLRDCANELAFPQFHTQYVLQQMAQAHPHLANAAQALLELLRGHFHIPEYADPLCLLPSLLSAQERHLTSHTEHQVSAAVVCHMSAPIAQHIFSRLCQQFAGRARFCGPFPVYDRRLLEQTQPQLILSTVDTKDFRNFPIPTITISPQLLPDDFHRVETALQRLLSETLYGA